MIIPTDGTILKFEIKFNITNVIILLCSCGCKTTVWLYCVVCGISRCKYCLHDMISSINYFSFKTALFVQKMLKWSTIKSYVFSTSACVTVIYTNSQLKHNEQALLYWIYIYKFWNSQICSILNKTIYVGVHLVHMYHNMLYGLYWLWATTTHKFTIWSKLVAVPTFCVWTPNFGVQEPLSNYCCITRGNHEFLVW